jgi:hypothetical protein
VLSTLLSNPFQAEPDTFHSVQNCGEGGVSDTFSRPMRLKDLIESGYGLGDSTVEPEQAGVEGASKQKVDTTRNALP